MSWCKFMLDILVCSQSSILQNYGHIRNRVSSAVSIVAVKSDSLDVLMVLPISKSTGIVIIVCCAFLSVNMCREFILVVFVKGMVSFWHRIHDQRV